jgi:hypothetical protein
MQIRTEASVSGEAARIRLLEARKARIGAGAVENSANDGQTDDTELGRAAGSGSRADIDQERNESEPERSALASGLLSSQATTLEPSKEDGDDPRPA